MRYTGVKIGIGILLFFLLISSAVAAETTMPNLMGTWKIVYIERDSSTQDYGNITMNETAIDRYVIESQNGPIFEGYKEFLSPDDNEVKNEGLTGVISDDRIHAYIKDHTEGIIIADITSPDTMTAYLLFGKDPQGRESAGVVRIELVRVTDQ